MGLDASDELERKQHSTGESVNASDVAQLYRNQGREVPAEFRDEKALRDHKYNAKRKEVEGIVFDSSSEADAYTVLKLWEASGAISDLKLQPVFVLQEKFTGVVDGKKKTHRAIKYIADFRFMMNDVETIVDVKGIKTQAFAIKEKLFRQKFPHLELQIWDRAKVRELRG